MLFVELVFGVSKSLNLSELCVRGVLPRFKNIEILKLWL
jgi:hypothetical protein